MGEEAGDDGVAGVAEGGRVDAGGGEDEAVAVAQAGEGGGGDRAVVLELGGAGDQDQRALVLGQLDRQRRRRVPEPGPDHQHARRHRPRVFERSGGEVEGEGGAVAGLGDRAEPRQAGGARPALAAGRRALLVE